VAFSDKALVARVKRPAGTSAVKVSISSTFYTQLLRRYSFAKKLQSQAVMIEKMRKAILYEKGVSKMLMKLTQAALKIRHWGFGPSSWPQRQHRRLLRRREHRRVREGGRDSDGNRARAVRAEAHGVHKGEGKSVARSCPLG